MNSANNTAEQSGGASVAPATSGLSNRWKFGILIIAFLFVLMPFLFWRESWFGLPLSDQQLQNYLNDTENPRKAQHALTQIAERMIRGDAAVKRYYPQVIALGNHRLDELRVTAAWVMGQDASAEEFHAPLLRLLGDANPMVRHNAALALVRFGDGSGRADIASMLRPYAMPASDGGTLAQRLKPGDAVNPGTLLARLKDGAQEREVRSKVPGKVTRWLVADGASVSPGAEIVEIAPSAEMVWEALRALYLVGQPEDLPLIERYTRVMDGMPSQIQRQAELTAQKIRERNRSQLIENPVR